MMVLLFILGLMAGFVVGVLVVRVNRRTTDGTLRVDTSDPNDGPYLFLQLSKSVDAVTRKRIVVLDVSTENFIPQK